MSDASYGMDPPYKPMSERDCKHGQLARSCEICELERALDEVYTLYRQALLDNAELKNKVSNEDLSNEDLLAENERLKAYADKLAEGLPCLPKDIEVLREANGRLASENERLEKVAEAAREAVDWLLWRDKSHPDATLLDAIGLRHIRVESNIAFDRDLEYRSAEAFRIRAALAELEGDDAPRT